jgi:hypothetical protein
VIEYFCSASSTGTQRPDLETIIRSLAGKLSLTLDFDVSMPAQIEFHKNTPGYQPDWKQLLQDLIDEESQTCDILFLVDALDECAETQDEAFLDFMKGVINPNSRPGVQFLFSARQHVSVKQYIDTQALHTVEVTASCTAKDMNTFVESEVECRRSRASISIFCKWA